MAHNSKHFAVPGRNLDPSKNDLEARFAVSADALQVIAEPSTVVIAESTRRLLGGLFELEDLGPRDFKGIAGPAVAFVYHCLDRVVTHGYLTGLSRPDQVAHSSDRWPALL